MKKPAGKRYKQSYVVRATTSLPAALTLELEKMMEKHRLKLGPLVVRLAMRGLLEYRKDGRLGTPQELGLRVEGAGETSPPDLSDENLT